MLAYSTGLLLEMFDGYSFLATLYTVLGCVVPCWKLVRDRVGEELERSGGNLIVYRVEDRSVLETFLRAKVVEEAVEFAASGSLEEAVDVFEALYEWLRLKGVGLDEVERVMREKRRVKGGFEKGYVVVWLDRETC